MKYEAAIFTEEKGQVYEAPELFTNKAKALKHLRSLTQWDMRDNTQEKYEAIIHNVEGDIVYQAPLRTINRN